MRVDAEAFDRAQEQPQDVNRKIKVLLVGENVHGSSYLVNRLWRRGCQCDFAASYEEVLTRLRSQEIYLVLCPTRLNGRNLLPLMDLLEGSRVSLFYVQSADHGCWWLPALRRGRKCFKCFGAGAVPPSEFISVLDEIIEQSGQLSSEANA